MPDSIATMPLVLPVPSADVRSRRDVEYAPDLLADVYSPADGDAHPAIVFIHGGPVPIGAGPKKMQIFRDYGALAATYGLTAITFNHRFYDAAAIERAADDVARAIDFAQLQPEVDAERLFLWVFSGGGLFLTFALDRPNVRAAVAYYAILDAPGRPQFSPLERLRAGAKCPPLFIARAGKDHAPINEAGEKFVAEALHRNIELELMTHPDGVHGFDIMNDDDRSRAIIRRTFEFVRENARRTTAPAPHPRA